MLLVLACLSLRAPLLISLEEEQAPWGDGDTNSFRIHPRHMD